LTHGRISSPRQTNDIVVGFAARGTLARRIIDGAEQVRTHGDDIRIGATIHTINGFSVHADKAEMLNWHRLTGSPEQTFLVHGDDDVMQHFATHLEDTRVEMPTLDQRFDL